MTVSAAGPLDGIRVIDCATLFAGPLAATILGDYGADVIKVEHPTGEGMRSMTTTPEGYSLWWAFVARNKRCVTLKLSDSEGAQVMRELIEGADVLIENFRPGTLEKWGLGPEVLHQINPGLVITRVTGFGQTGPYSQRPGYGTLAEAMSGFAYVNGWPDKPPSLPPFALGDGIAAMATVSATMFALWWRDMGAGAGRGQVVDMSIYEPLFWINGPQVSIYEKLGEIPIRQGNQVPHTVPRNVYQTSDGHWVALSASTPNVSNRVAKIIGRPDLLEQPWYGTHSGRVEHRDEVDTLVSDWIGARTRDEVLSKFDEGNGAIAAVYSVADIAKDPHYQYRESFTTVMHEEHGPITMQNLIARLESSPGEVRFPGAALGQHNNEVYSALGISPERIAALAKAEVI